MVKVREISVLLTAKTQEWTLYVKLLCDDDSSKEKELLRGGTVYSMDKKLMTECFFWLMKSVHVLSIFFLLKG